MNRPWSYLPGRHIPIGLPWGEHKPSRWVYLPIAGYSKGSGKSGHPPTKLFHRTIRVVRPLARRSTQAIGIAGHHRLVLSLGNLVFAEVKPFGEGHIMLGLISSSSRFRGRASHRECTWRTPDHIHRHGGIQIHGAVTHYGDRSVGSGGIPRGIRHGVS